MNLIEPFNQEAVRDVNCNSSPVPKDEDFPSLGPVETEEIDLARLEQTSAKVEKLFKVFAEYLKIIRPSLAQELKEAKASLATATLEHEPALQGGKGGHGETNNAKFHLQQELQQVKSKHKVLVAVVTSLRKAVAAQPEKIRIAAEERTIELSEKLSKV